MKFSQVIFSISKGATLAAHAHVEDSGDNFVDKGSQSVRKNRSGDIVWCMRYSQALVQFIFVMHIECHTNHFGICTTN